MREKIFIFLAATACILPATALAEESSSALPAPNLSFKLICGSTPQGKFTWNQISGANVYQLYTIKGQNFTPKEVFGTETTLNLSRNEDYKYTVEAMVKEDGKVKKEGEWSNEIFVKGDSVAKECGFTNGEEREDDDNGKISELKEDGKEEKVEKPKVQVVEKVVEKVASDNGKTSELEEKVGKLSQDLEQAKQRQNALEQLIQNLLNILKNIFKFSF